MLASLVPQRGLEIRYWLLVMKVSLVPLGVAAPEDVVAFDAGDFGMPSWREV